jgi:hypothetical protein
MLHTGISLRDFFLGTIMGDFNFLSHVKKYLTVVYNIIETKPIILIEKNN